MDQFEKQRLTVLHEESTAHLREAATKWNETQIDVAKEATQFFEKLAIGSGATIAAMVSFLGSHTGRLQPPWLLRVSLVALVTAIFSALYRNFGYPLYVLEIRHRLWVEAQVEEQEYRGKLVSVQTGYVADKNTGKQIDQRHEGVKMAKSVEEARAALDSRGPRERRLRRNWQWAEWLCLVSVSVAMASLVWLALENF